MNKIIPSSEYLQGERYISPLILTPGPVMMDPDILVLGGTQTPYFRNSNFSAIYMDCEMMLLAAVNAPSGSRAVFITGSGTAAMEAAVINFTSYDKPVLVVQGGGFGQRFVDIGMVHRRQLQVVPGDRIRSPLSSAGIACNKNYAGAVLINAHETSTGHLYDLHDSANYCRKTNALHIVDAISAFGADNIDMQEHFIDVLILSSNKALGLQPGLSMLVLSPRAIELLPSQPLSYYFNISSMLNDGQRGQTPFTPAVNILLQLQLRLAKWIKLGMSTVLARTAQNANHFRRAIVGLPLKFYSSSMSNALTAIEVTNSISAISVVERLESEHGIVVAPNGGSLAERVFRISHLGNVGIKEMDYAASALGTVLMEN